MKSTSQSKTKLPSSAKRWEIHCTEALSRMAGIRVVDYARRQACNAVLEKHLASHITSEKVGASLAVAFQGRLFKKEDGKLHRTPGSTPFRLFRAHHIAQLIHEHTDILISKRSILMSLGAELESAILADLTPTRIRKIICQGMDDYLPQPPRKRKPRITVAQPLGPERILPQAPEVSGQKNGSLPV